MTQFVEAKVQKSELIPLVILGVAVAALTLSRKAWSIPASGLPYKTDLDNATNLWQLPPNLLARVAYQESRFRPDIITGKTVSSAGAQGIMQIVPKWHPDVDPLNSQAAIFYAAKYLHSLYNQFGTWERALAAYNWGPGNLKKFINGSITTMPTETKNYVKEIAADVFGSNYG